jgi:hypothetical protein
MSEAATFDILPHPALAAAAKSVSATITGAMTLSARTRLGPYELVAPCRTLPK